ncbi:helix-turn-helix transcriptional regulator [Allobaculum sp. Allo2]|nr:helix-turn-helix transcriptional regulator [Allobaculum sp. Allo2]
MSKRETPIDLEEGSPEYAIVHAILDTRERLQITQSELARRTGIDQGDISKLERGHRNPSLKLLKRLADGLGMELRISFIPIEDAALQNGKARFSVCLKNRLKRWTEGFAFQLLHRIPKPLFKAVCKRAAFFHGTAKTDRQKPDRKYRNQTENRERLGCGSAYTPNKTGLESAAAFSYWPCRPSGLPVL